jgi:hypothetical protein
MQQDLEKYYTRIDNIIATLTNLTDQLIDESSKGVESDPNKISHCHSVLKVLLGTKSAVEAIATLVKIQAKLAESIVAKGYDRAASHQDPESIETTYAYFVSRYESEQKNQQSMTFKEFIDKITLRL